MTENRLRDTMVNAVQRAKAMRANSAPLKAPQPAPVPRLPGEPVVERTRADVGLKLIGELAAAAYPDSTAKWKYEVDDEQRRCFLGYLKPDYKDPSALNNWFEIIKDGTPWEQPIRPSTGLPIPRKTAWLAATTCRCTYRYGGLEVDPVQFPDWMIELMELYMPMCGLTSREAWPNSCNMNLYEDGSHSVAWHADDEKLFQGKMNDCTVLSLSLGAARSFQARVNQPVEGERQATKLLLGNGDLCTMEGLFQKHYQHCVPKERSEGPRINLTWRWIKLHNLACPMFSRRR